MPFDGSKHPANAHAGGLETGGNCQRYAYELLRLTGRPVRPHRSSDLWADPHYPHPERPEPLDLALFGDRPYGAHVAVVVDDEHLLHLCAEVGRPAQWTWADFAARPRYANLIGLVRVPRT